MQIADSLIQTYFLGARPGGAERVAAQLEKAAPEDRTSPWSLFARLERPGLVALRAVRRTTGLDLFLFEKPAVEEIEDVAEFMTFSVEGGTGADDGGGEAAAEMEAVLHGSGCLFITFIRLNWDVLENGQMWAQHYGIEAPSRSGILEGAKRALRRAGREGMLSAYQARGETETAEDGDSGKEKNERIRFHLACGTGDSDIIVYGRTSSRTALDYFLLTLTQMGTDCLAQEAGALVTSESPWHPVLSVSTTELAIPWKHYRQAMKAAAKALPAAEGAPWCAAEKALAPCINKLLAGGLHASVILRRSETCLADLQDEVRRALPEDWADEAVLGDADVIIRNTRQDAAGSLAQLVQLLARLDVQAAGSSYFPRRISLIVSFGAPCGRANQTSGGCPARREILWSGVSEARHGTVAGPAPESTDGIASCLAYLNGIRNQRLREEIRIVERMVERCLILQRNPELSSHTRRMARLSMGRIVRVVNRLGAQLDEEQELLRSSLVRSGSHLDRTLSYLTRGSVPLLLSSTMHARITDHFASETFLGKALGAPTVSVAARLQTALARQQFGEAGPPPRWEGLLETLADMTEPVIYSTHEVDFRLIPPLGLIHVPRWVMWYPTASSFILHELGHAVFNEVQLGRLMRAVAQSVADSPSPWRSCCAELAQAGLAAWDTRHQDDQAWETWQRDQDEVAAELFNRLFAYEADAAPRYFLDQLEHFHSVVRRTDVPKRRSFLSRALSVHIARHLLQKFGENFETADPAAAAAALDAARHQFSQFALAWCQHPPPPFNEPGVEGAAEARAEARLLFNEIEEHRGSQETCSYQTVAGRSVQRGVFMAWVAAARKPFPGSPGGPGGPRLRECETAQQVWAAILAASQEPDAASPQERAAQAEIVRQLCAGVVPRETTRWPERLPRQVHARRRDAWEPVPAPDAPRVKAGSTMLASAAPPAGHPDRASVLIRHRFALTLYLTDWETLYRNRSLPGTRHAKEPLAGPAIPALPPSQIGD